MIGGLFLLACYCLLCWALTGVRRAERDRRAEQ